MSTPLLDPGLRGAASASFELRVTGEPVFGGQRIEVAPVTIEVDCRPRLEALEVTWGEVDVSFTCQARSWPPSKAVALRLVRLDTGAATALGAEATFDVPHGKRPGEGLRDPMGERVRARLPRVRVVEALGAGTRFRAELFRPTGAGYDAVLGQEVAPATVEGRVE